MTPTLRLKLTDYLDPTRWRWALYDERGHFLADHDVQLDPTGREYAGFLELSDYLDYYEPIQTVEAQLAELGAWIGERVFGRLRDALWERRASPALPVHVTVPPEADDLLQRPFELARFADGPSFPQAGLRFVYQIEGAGLAAANGVVAVAALATAGPPHEALAVAPFSNVRAVVAAPGVGVHSARRGGGYTSMSGTSMAALWTERQLQRRGVVDVGEGLVAALSA